MSFSDSTIQLLISHNKQAFADFYNATVDGFWRFLQSRYFINDAVKDDLIHDFYVKLWRVLDQYDNSYSFETWYWTIFRNHIKDHFKASREDHNDTLLDDLTTESSQLDLVEMNFQKTQLDQALSKLDEDSALIVTLRYLEEKEYDEIAKIVQMTESTVRKRLSRALKTIKKDILNTEK